MKLPEGESTRKALLWISQRRKTDPGVRIAGLIDEASKRFDLSPLEQEALLTWLASGPDAPSEGPAA